MTHPTDYEPETDSGADHEPCRGESSKHLKLLETLIDKIIERIQDDSCQLRVRDALKAIQLREKVAKVSEAEQFFWEQIDNIRDSQLSEPTTLETQIQRTISRLAHQVKNGILPVKDITDTFNESRFEHARLTYRRMSRLLSAMGFTKARTSNGRSAIIWNDELLLCPPDKGERGGSCFAPAKSPDLSANCNSIDHED